MKFDLTPSAVHYILRINKELLKLDRDFERVKRVNQLKRIYKNVPDAIKKDKVDVLAQIRNEFELDKQNLNVFQQFFQLEPDSSVKNRLTEAQNEQKE